MPPDLTAVGNFLQGTMSSFEEAKAEALKLFAPSLPNDEIVPIVSKLPQELRKIVE